jgi:hypothetical protein
MYYNERAKMENGRNYLISWYISNITIMKQVFASILNCNGQINFCINLLIYNSNFICCSKSVNVVKCNPTTCKWCIYEIL